jgi:hypothetical protein
MRMYWNLMEDSRGTLGCPERGLAIEVFKVNSGVHRQKMVFT